MILGPETQALVDKLGDVGVLEVEATEWIQRVVNEQVLLSLRQALNEEKPQTADCSHSETYMERITVGQGVNRHIVGHDTCKSCGTVVAIW